jgi:PhnB protein
MSAPSNAQQPAMPIKGGVIAYLQVDGAMKAADFYRRAFGAELVAAHPADDKGRTMHVHLYVNGTSLMLSDPYPEHGYAPQMPQAFHLMLPVATVVMPVAEMFWGDRYGQLRGPFGVLWAMDQPRH